MKQTPTPPDMAPTCADTATRRAMSPLEAYEVVYAGMVRLLFGGVMVDIDMYALALAMLLREAGADIDVPMPERFRNGALGQAGDYSI